jgi:uncharacterized protein (DUF2252 family)
VTEQTAHAAPVVTHLSKAERADRGRLARKKVPRAALGAWEPPAERADPVALLREQETRRVPELVAVRHERMLVSAFTFYRGAAVIMASDLATRPRTDLIVQCCGDAHLSNFGGFAAPDRQMVFDLNDFDETSRGPFEWDVKRLATSFEIAARDRAFEPSVAHSIARHVAEYYRQTMAELAAMGNLDVWYARIDADAVLDRWANRATTKEVKRFQREVAKAQSKDSLRAMNKLTERVDGEIRIANDHPLVVRLDDLARDEGMDKDTVATWVRERFRQYRYSLQPDRRHLLEGYEIVDLARKVVGVGSVGTRCWIAAMVGSDETDPLFLQIKEAERSVLEAYAGKSDYASSGQRVVEGQRLLQASSDILLGWLRTPALDGVVRDYYVRQLWDGKLSPNLERMSPEVFTIYAELCAWTLARGHARSGDRVAISSYLGTGQVFDQAIEEFATGYADQNQRDYDAAKASLSSS